MNQTELPECEKINKKEPSKDVQMTQKQADRLVEHLKNIFMYVRVLRPDEIGDFIVWQKNKPPARQVEGVALASSKKPPVII